VSPWSIAPPTQLVQLPAIAWKFSRQRHPGQQPFHLHLRRGQPPRRGEGSFHANGGDSALDKSGLATGSQNPSSPLAGPADLLLDAFMYLIGGAANVHSSRQASVFGPPGN
jgi:hypothetical protein